MANAKAAYDIFARELAEVEAATGLYLADENVDAENSLDGGETYDSDAFWSVMLINAKMAAGQRAEDAGQDINALIGRVIY
jgi:hypothetical protein